MSKPAPRDNLAHTFRRLIESRPDLAKRVNATYRNPYKARAVRLDATGK